MRSTVWSLNNVEVNDFMKLVEECKGNVYLVTSEGDKLNLKSTLCSLIGLASIIKGGVVANASLVCDKVEDEGILLKYKLYKKIESVETASQDEASGECSEDETVA